MVALSPCNLTNLLPTGGMTVHCRPHPKVLPSCSDLLVILANLTSHFILCKNVFIKYDLLGD